MFCSQCGNSMPDTSHFCPKCGQPVVAAPGQPSGSPPQEPQGAETLPLLDGSGLVPADPPPADSVVLPPPPPMPPTPLLPPDGDVPPRQKSKALPFLIAGIALVSVAILVGGVFLFRTISSNNAYKEQMSSGSARMSDGDYGEAVACFQEALERKPEDPAAALSLAGAYLSDSRFSDAESLLSGLTLDEADERYAALQQLLALARMSEDISAVDTGAFPLVTLSLSCQDDPALSADQLKVVEGGAAREIKAFQVEDGVALISYLSEDTDESDQPRSLSLTFQLDDVQIVRDTDYITPHFAPAELDLVSTDVSQYPLVKAYFRVSDSDTGENVDGLTANSFTILERVQGGEYLAREVRSAAPLEGNAGLNIDLVADKSDSISTSDMSKIKSVMTEFVKNLHYTDGDRAEVLAFDSIVQQMCSYTGDAVLLANGINNMSTDGMTALYDAIYDGITHAALQGGARCVIAFTDGGDNVSRHNPNDVISYSNSMQVPVYIVGVGYGVEASTLQAIANSTGGRYWFIDDLYDLQEIFDQIYAEQKQLYVVEYESDSALDNTVARDLSIKVSGSGHRTESSVSFTPVRSAAGGGHSSRYQLVKESLSWEAASQKCQEMGGHLATITSQAEMDELTQMAQNAGARYVWLGGYTSHDDANQVFGHWVTGEDFAYSSWAPGEPSRIDQDGTEEWYIMLWNIQSLGGWTWNDQRNDPAAVIPTMQDGMAYICEFEG